jgi:hypothetical protein
MRILSQCGFIDSQRGMSALAEHENIDNTLSPHRFEHW